MNKFIQILSLAALIVGASAHGMDPSYASPLASEGEIYTNQLGQDLCKAADAGDLSLVQQLLAQGAPLETKSQDGKTPLMHAAECGRINVCLLLIENNASIEAKSSCGKTALSYAAHNGNKETCQLLIKNHASVNTKDIAGLAPLFWATEWVAHIEDNDTSICQLLIDTIAKQIRAENRPKAITFLGMKRFCKTEMLKPVNMDAARLIAHLILEPTEQQKANLFEQLNKVKNHKLKQELMQYAHAQLQAPLNYNTRETEPNMMKKLKLNEGTSNE